MKHLSVSLISDINFIQASQALSDEPKASQALSDEPKASQILVLARQLNLRINVLSGTVCLVTKII